MHRTNIRKRKKRAHKNLHSLILNDGERKVQTMSSKSKAAIARSNKRKGSAGNLMFKKYLQGLFQGSRVWNSHRRSGDEFGADLVLDSGKVFCLSS